ncbi:MAG: hypothetical protein ACT4P8_12420 [Betaproteobacteria bacterium]
MTAVEPSAFGGGIHEQALRSLFQSRKLSGILNTIDVERPCRSCGT